jgi:protein phosphatase
LTDIGAVRKDNQDSYAIRVLDDRLAVLVVCDGMGGARAGNVASAVAVESFCSAVEERCRDGVPTGQEQRGQLLRAACRRANSEVHDLSLTNREYMGMGTTLVAALILPDEIYVLNVGDSRCYLLGEGGIQQLTRDHSLVQALVDRGELTPDQARFHPKKNLITRALGVESEVSCDLYQVDRAEYSHLLLCSDGLSNVLSDQIIAQAVTRAPEPEDACRALLALTMEEGAPDNVTAVLARL